MRVFSGLLISGLTTSVAAVAVVFGAVACSDDDSKTTLNPAGPPMVRQVFLSERVMLDTNGDGTPNIERNRVQMAFGDHPDIPLDDDARDGVSNAVPLGNKIRIVMDELLDGSTLEQIECADGTYSDILSGTTPDDVAECAGVDRRDCTAVCTQINTDDNQPVGIMDENDDGAADSLRFKEDIVHVICGDVEMTLDFDSVSKTFWNPSGNQQIPAGSIGIGGLGPAIVVVADAFRTGSTCIIEIDDTVVDKDGNPICAPEGGDIDNDCSGGDTSRLSFGSQGLKLLGSSPQNGGVNVVLGLNMLLQFNSILDPNSIDPDGDMIPDNVTLSTGGVAIAAAIATETADTAVVKIEVTGGLLPSTEYTIHAQSGANGLTDAFGAPLPEDIDIVFNTCLGDASACDISRDFCCGASTCEDQGDGTGLCTAPPAPPDAGPPDAGAPDAGAPDA